MTWDVTADHERFEEAVSWFRSRVPYTHDEMGALADKSRTNAFWIAGGLELSAVQTVFDEIAAALEKGTPLEDFKKAIRETLGAKFGVSGYHLETVFRNWTQASYNTGRWYQLTDPDLAAVRPYLLYDAILDSRTTKLCESLNGTVKPVGDPFWLTHWPPLHHRCRSSPRSLTRSEAGKRGVTEGTPDVTVQSGFGLAPPVRGDQPPRPDPARIDSDVWTAYKVREEQMQRELAEAQRRADEARRLQDPKHWFDTEYRDKYGEDGGRAVAWGRAMQERGKAVSMTEAKRQYLELTENIGVTTSGHPTPLFTRVRDAEEDGFIAKGLKTLGELDEALSAAVDKTPSLKRTLDEVRALAGLIGQRAGVKPAGQAVNLGAPRVPRSAPKELHQNAREILDKVSAFWAQLSDTSLVLPDKRRGYIVQWSKQRAKFDDAARIVWTQYETKGKRLVDTGFSTIVHEMGHGLEHHNARARRAAEEFLERRTVGEAAVSLRKLTRLRYRANEVTKKDLFFNPYMGKEYLDRMGRRYATEVSSMALEKLHKNAAELVELDAEAFWFALGQLAGESVK